MAIKTAYLTIDDSPSIDMGEKIEYLSVKGISAVWFCSGASLEKKPRPAVEAIHRWHPIGNHAYDHPHFSDIPFEECFDQIERTDRIIGGLYEETSVPWRRKYFRFPYGDKGALTGDDALAAPSAEGAR